GEAGQLVYGGYRIEDLAENTSFEEVCHLLWYGDLPNGAQLSALRRRFIQAMAVDPSVIDVVRRVASHSHPMATLRTAVSALSATDPDAEDMSPEAADRKAVRLTGQTITLTAAIERVRSGRDPVAPRDDLSLAANLLYMMHGESPDELAERIIDAALILHAEHGMNASTFSARVTTSTLADMHSAVTSAIGTLKGPLHGGANERVMQMLLAIDQPANAAQWVRDALGRGEKIMGFGHRVYRTLDPRAPILKKLAEELLDRGGDTRWLEISGIIQSTMREEMDRKGKKIYPNVDFFSASVYYTLGIPMDLFTNVFACARMAGWTAHVKEQLADNRLIRPKAEYAGPTDRTTAPVEQRA
ncbi:MAG TPA: citrate/2-methylcitrate synthase, partial [Longimicrobiales bacterium]|nr:citrate/2-methylcitrate synthase [Longimicrobiales bacterium]